MKVDVNIIYTSCILVSKAVSMPRLMVMTLLVSEESLARDTDTDTLPQTNRQLQTDFGLVYLTLFQKS